MKFGPMPGRIPGNSCCWKPNPEGCGGIIPGAP
uniref:Uncharacterized protein n=1 Tax=Rhizophora mucronata TaxID=61149 RepID=A0A2P2N3G1_RHIMU